VSDAQFYAVFGQSLWIIVGSVIAFAVSQLVDVGIFWLVRHRTGGRFLWLRATGSTVVSQLIDSIVIIGVAFWLPGKIKTSEFLTVAGSNYSFKLIIAVGITPLLYAGHAAIDRFLGAEEAHELVEQSAKASEETVG
jgi:queuosine precursor transporter